MDTGLWFISNNIYTLKTGNDFTPELVETAIKLQGEAADGPVTWPYIKEEYFEKAAGILGIPDYRSR